jgi:hypothetical protein
MRSRLFPDVSRDLKPAGGKCPGDNSRIMRKLKRSYSHREHFGYALATLLGYIFMISVATGITTFILIVLRKVLHL